MPADAPDPQIRPEVVVGRYVLVLGDPAGTAIVATASRDEPHTLAQAITRARRERAPPPTGAASLESAVEDASQTTSKAERAVRLFTEIAQGRLDPAAVSDDVDALLGLLRRLDRDERWGEALRVARSLAMLLALLRRWVDLLQSLQVALSAAEQLGDAGSQAWGLHELGTLHLAAEKHADADRLLSQAHDLRERIGDRRGLAMTDRNLQILCRALRTRLHEPPRWRALEQLLRRPVPALIFGILLLMAGGAAGAVIRGTTTGQGTQTVVVHAKSSSKSIKSHTGVPLQPGSHPPTVTTEGTLPNSPTVTPPSAPTEVTAKAGASQASVSWRAPPSTGGSKITSYTVTPYAGGSAQPPVEIAPTETSTIVGGLINGTSYSFTVTATNAVGAGPASEHSNAVTPHATIY